MAKHAKTRMNMVLCWHMHQPWYRESQQGDYQLPWVYLHALKDYVDMVAHLEAHPNMRCVVNFTPVLLEQLDDYARQFREHLKSGKRFADPLLNLLAGIDPIPSDADARVELVAACRRAHAPLMIDVHVAFRDLFDMVMSLDNKQVDRTRLQYMNDQFFLDLLSWYHLTWLGHSLKQLPHVQRLLERKNDFDTAVRRDLLQVMSDAFDGLIGRYAALARVGQIELSMTPYGHPIVPLLIDLDAMHGAMPEAHGPKATGYPGGLERARWHMREGLRVFERYLGCKPAGVWLSEGGVSTPALQVLDEFGIEWTASGEGVWQNSRYLSRLPANGEEARRSLFCAHSVGGCETRIFFRDDGLSDMIGFEYQQWDARDAAANFGQHLENIADYLGDSCHEQVVSVILDGENAWEYYPDNGFHFIGALYEHLADNPRIETLTFSEALNACGAEPLPKLCPGSWVYGSFSTWIGEDDKNLAWDMLVEAKRVFDRVVAKERFAGEKLAQLERQLAICEGSDWFWWFGDYNPSDSVSDFDRLYRQQLRNLYDMLGVEPPPGIDTPVSSGGGPAENAGTMRDVDMLETDEQYQTRRAGVLLHVTSLPSGRIDDDCLRWLDFMSESGLGVWQMLPLVIPDTNGSPYQSRSAFACNPGLLPADDGPVRASDVDEYHARHAAWLDDFALFEVLKHRYGERPWVEWPAALRDRDEEALGALQRSDKREVRRVVEEQYRLDRAWRRVRSHAEDLGITLFGDIPIFIAHDSADTWSQPEKFLLDSEGCPTYVTGVPPDYFAADGQRWGNPHYRWDRMQEDGFAWWLARMHHQFDLFDLVRIDHFRGLVAVWMIDAACETAVDGYWQETPGDALLATLGEHFPTLPIVAEDLGVITEEVRTLRRKYGLSGMSILQFAFDGFSDNPHKPVNITKDCITYTGTHDNDTCVGWFEGLEQHQRDFVFQVLGVEPTPDIAGLLVETAMQTRAWLAVAPLQDFLGLDGTARMNTPGVSGGNWRWRFSWDMLQPGLGQHLRAMIEAAGRLDER